MTKADFEKIATLFAKRESQIEELDVDLGAKISARLSHRRTVMDFSNMFAENHPRFNKGLFEKWALPIYSAQLSERIVAKMVSQQRP